MAEVDFSKCRIADFPVPVTLTENVVLRLDALKRSQTPFDCIGNHTESIVDIGGDDAKCTNNIRVRFHFEKVQQLSGDKLTQWNYLSLFATFLSRGDLEPHSVDFSVSSLNQNLAVMKQLKEKKVYLNANRDLAPELLVNKMIYYSVNELSIGNKETLNDFPEYYGVAVMVWCPADKLQQVAHERPVIYDVRNDTDIKLETEDGLVLHAHKFILSERSSVLKDLIQKEVYTPGFSGTLKLHGIKGSPLRIILHFMYTNGLNTEVNQVMDDVLAVAKLLEMPDLLTFLDTNMITICHPGNMMRLFIAAQENGLGNAMNDIRNYIKLNIDDITPNA